MNVHMQEAGCGIIRILFREAGEVIFVRYVLPVTPFSIATRNDLRRAISPGDRLVPLTTSWETDFGKAVTLRSRYEKACHAFLARR